MNFSFKLPRPSIFFILSLLPIYFLFVYLDTYGKNIPTNDQWLDSINIAVEAKEGTLTFEDITRVYYGHRAAFTNAFTAFLACTTSWNVKLELYLSFALAIGRFMLVVLIFRALCPEMTPLTLLPFSLLIFSMYQYLVWLSGIYSVWHFVSFFSLAAVWILIQFEVGWRPLIAASVMAFCASFSQGSGLVTFPVLLITLWMFGYRHPKFYLFWTLFMAGTLWLYFYNSNIGLGGETTDTSSSINFREPFVLIKFVFAFLGNPFTYYPDTDTPMYIGMMGVILLVINLAYLWQQTKNWKMLAPWLTLTGFAASVAIMIYLTRYREDRFTYAIEQRYALVSTNLWIALVATIVLIARQGEKKPILLPVNLIFAGVLVILYVQANFWNLQATAFRYQYTFGEEFPPQESCILNFPLKRDFSCIESSVPLGEASEDDIYRLAYYDLALFHGQQKAINLLPDNYREGSPILLDTPSRWMNAYLRRWYLSGVNEDVLFHVAPEAVEIPADTLLERVVTGYGEETAALLENFLEGQNTVWYIRTREAQPNESAAFETLTNLGYLPTVIPLNDYHYNSEITIVRYERKPDELTEMERFGEFITLQSVTFMDENFEPCQLVAVQTWWQTEQTPAVTYALHLQLVNEDGQILTENAGGLTPVPGVFWSPGQLYLDERSITLPCDLPAGNYTLQLSIENPQTGEYLPVQDGEAVILEGTF